jgi:hypothetical protein
MADVALDVALVGHTVTAAMTDVALDLVLVLALLVRHCSSFRSLCASYVALSSL